MVPADSRRISRVLRYSGAVSPPTFVFAYGAFTRYGRPFQGRSANDCRVGFVDGPTTPRVALPQPRFGLLRVRSPLLAESLLFSFPPATKMFQFTGLAPRPQSRGTPCGVGCPIRKSASQRVFAPRRGLSQLITSFFASESQGILYVPLSPFLYDLRFNNRLFEICCCSFVLRFAFQNVNVLLSGSPWQS